MRPAPLVICSQVSNRDFLMYLVAVKSFYARIGEGRVCAIDDGSLTPDQRNELRRHIPDILLLHVRDAPALKAPRGGCWERLALVAELAKTNYVIQLDSDTLTRGHCTEVCEAWRAGRPFILAGDRGGARVIERLDASHNAARLGGNHIQTAVEQRLSSIPGLKPLYVRGSGAFFGIPPGKLSLAEIEEWSAIMAGEFGARWNEWGTEQVSVNYLLANLEGLRVLEAPKYTHRWREAPGEDSAFIHFIGSHRFDRQFYAFQSRKTIRTLQRPLFIPGALTRRANESVA